MRNCYFLYIDVLWPYPHPPDEFNTYNIGKFERYFRVTSVQLTIMWSINILFIYSLLPFLDPIAPKAINYVEGGLIMNDENLWECFGNILIDSTIEAISRFWVIWFDQLLRLSDPGWLNFEIYFSTLNYFICCLSCFEILILDVSFL